MARGAVLWGVGALVLSAALAAPPPVPHGPLLNNKTVSFRLDEPLKLDLAVGGLRVAELRIVHDEASLLDAVLPPRGGVTRFSWLRYTLYAENPGVDDWALAARIRLLDRKGEVIDEFEFRKGVGSGRARSVDFKRLTLNYIVPLIDRIEVTLSAEQ